MDNRKEKEVALKMKEEKRKKMKVMMMETGYFVMDDKEGRGAWVGIKKKKDEGSDKRRKIKMNGLRLQGGKGEQRIEDWYDDGEGWGLAMD